LFTKNLSKTSSQRKQKQNKTLAGLAGCWASLPFLFANMGTKKEKKKKIQNDK